jgi:glycosyltransferase involved in cell wall biosynthesis
MDLRRPAAIAASLLLVLAGGWRVLQPVAARPVPGAEIQVPAMMDLQSALNAVQPGQSIVLEPGRVYEGPFRLPRKDGGDWITIRTGSAQFAMTVPAGRRVKPADARMMPKLIASRGNVIEAEAGAHHYRFIGLEVAPAPGVFVYHVIDLGTDGSDPAAIPHDFDFQRMYVHGDPAKGSRRGFALNSASTTIVDSYISDFKEVGQDSQAICGWNGPGPFTITNNYLEGAGENLMFGGGDPTIRDLVPSDIQIRRNTFSKPLEWRRREGTPAPDTPHWAVKNVLELKNARRVVIDGNTFEHSWLDAQVGYVIVFTPRNQDGGSPWSVVEDVTFSNNIVRHAAAAVNILGWDDIHDSQQTKRIRIVNNLFMDIGGDWGFGRLFSIANGTADLVIDHNTALQTETPVFGGDTKPHTGFVFTNNIVPHNEYGFIGSNVSPGRPTIERYFPDATIRRNAIVGGEASRLPPDNFFPATLAAVGFAGADQGNYRLLPASALRGKGTDGRDLGADLDAIARAIGNMAVPREPASQAGLAAATFWSAFGVVAYTYVGYPVMLWILSRGRRRPAPVPMTDAELPQITIVVVVYNEEQRIRRRIENLVNSNYPADKRDIVIASDGSTDLTVDIARASDASVRVLDFKNRRGKAAVLNDILPRLTTDIIVLTDARQRFELNALRALVAPFADRTIGGVSGELILKPDRHAQAGSQGTGLYWRYETAVRRWESDVDSTVGVTGAVTALRRSLFRPVPADTLLDDVLIPLWVTRQGYRVIFNSQARAHDGLPASDRGEFARKVRTLAGNFQLFSRERWLLAPWRNRLWWQTLSHKGLRLVLPLLFAAVLIANVMLLDQPLYRVLLVLQLGFYAAAALGLWRPLRRRVRWIVLPYTICFLAAATTVGAWRYFRGRQHATWDRTTLDSDVSAGAAAMNS